jgi:hypothetical protein
VKISWTAPSSGYATIDKYEINIYDSSNAWITTTECDGSSSTVIANLYCTVSMSTLTSSPFSLTFDTAVTVRVRAHNSIDYGDWSSTYSSGAKTRRVPSTMSAPTIASYSDSSINVTWTALSSPDNGNSDILAYELVWDSGLDVVPATDLSNTLTTYYVLSSSQITSGTKYRFAVRARNIYGSATSYSSETVAYAYDVPAKMSMATVATSTTSGYTDGTYVDITWTQPSSHGSTVDQYEVSFKKSDSSYSTDASCNPTSASS